ncbi:MAG: ABC-type transport auxiliary lipoprotein family protein [Gallionella sp.]|nr:ABC-type transport auxiliary lipoprotein family protein [Gallionella sp.]
MKLSSFNLKKPGTNIRLPCRIVPVLALLLTACSALPSPRVANTHFYLLDAGPVASASHAKSDKVLAISMTSGEPGFDTPQMAYIRQAHELEYFANHQWADTPARMLKPLLVQALESDFRAVVQAPGGIPAEIRLDTDLIRLQQDFSTKPGRVQLTLRAQLINVKDKKVIAIKLFDESENTPSDDAYGGVIAANLALGRILNKLVVFCLDATAHQ